ncbi:MAG: phage head closure protein [Bacillaceae bacterium]|nr:phage head closure protein [Bacillaceae bacterium]
MNPFKYRPKINSGRLNKRIKLLVFTEPKDDAGGYVDEWPNVGWEEIATLWASVEPLRGRDFYEAQQSQAEISHKVIIRYREGVERSQTINFKGRRFDIEYIINPNEKNQFLELMCVERL